MKLGHSLPLCFPRSNRQAKPISLAVRVRYRREVIFVLTFVSKGFDNSE